MNTCWSAQRCDPDPEKRSILKMGALRPHGKLSIIV
jgi:hypothetical protein